MKAILSRLVPNNWNDVLSIVLIVLIVALWAIQGVKIIALRDDVNGALVVLFTLVVQYYFRKAPETK